MKGKKKEPTPIVKIRKSGIVQRDMHPMLRAGRYWRGAYFLMPKFNLWIKMCCLVALLGALACLLIVFSRPRPILLVSFPDGTTLCSLPPLDPATGQVLPRPSSEAELCDMLAKRSGRGTDKDNAEFAKVVQVEPPSEQRNGIRNPLEDPAAPAPTVQPAPSTEAPMTPQAQPVAPGTVVPATQPPAPAPVQPAQPAVAPVQQGGV